MSQTSAPQLDLRGWVLLISLALIWAGAFYFTEIALEGYRPFTLVLGRVGVAAVALFACAASACPPAQGFGAPFW